MLAHEQPLIDGGPFIPQIGGAAGPGTLPGNRVSRPAGMPTRDDATHIVSTKEELLDAVTTDGAIVYVEGETGDEIDVTGEYGVVLGEGVEIVAGYCDPNIEGRGVVIKQDYYNPPRYGEQTARTFISRYGEAPTLWGVSFKGPCPQYFDPRDRVASDDWDSDDVRDWYASGLWVYDDDTFEAHGCEFWHWPLAGVEVGSRGHLTGSVFDRCSFHHNNLETLGYGVQVYNGDAEFRRCFFDACRHGISGFGYPDCSWTLSNSVVGPNGWSGHALDMHCLANNLSSSAASKYPLGGDTAGGDIRIQNCSLMVTEDVGGYGQEAFALRGIPTGEVRIEKCHFWHGSKPTTPNVQGNAYRQETDRWRNFYVRDNAYGPDANPEGAGAPLDQTGYTMSELTVIGDGPRGAYEIVVEGDVEATKNVDSHDGIVSMTDEKTKIEGVIVGGTDTYRLADDAVPLRATLHSPCQIVHDDEDKTARLTAVGAAHRADTFDTRIEETSQWVRDQIGNLRIVAGES